MDYEDGYLDGYKQAFKHVLEYLDDEKGWMTHTAPAATDYIQAIDKFIMIFNAWSMEVDPSG